MTEHQLFRLFQNISKILMTLTTSAYLRYWVSVT